MEGVNKTEYGLMAVRVGFYFAASAIIIWIFSDYYSRANPTLIPYIDLVQIKSLWESLIYFVLFIIIFLPTLLRLLRARQSIDDTCESSLFYQRLLSKVTHIYNEKGSLNTSVASVLENMGVDLDLSRTYLYKFNPNSRALNITHQWFKEDTTPLSKTQSIEVFQYPIFQKWISENNPVYIVDIKSISDNNTKALLLSRNVVSLLVIPFSLNADSHYLLFLESDRLRKWTKNDVSFLQSISTILTSIIDSHEKNAQIQQVDILKSRFIEVISNQLRGPLQAMKQNVDNIASMKLGNLNDIQQKVLGYIRQTNQNISSKISNMLLMLDFQAGNISLDKTEIDLISLVDSEYSDFVQLCLLKDQKPLLLKPTTGSYKAFIDKEKVAFAMRSLLQNATFYSHKYAEIKVKIELSKDTYIFSVQDQGIGIPVQDQGSIFTPFYRALNAKEMKADSPGISLFLTKTIVEAHGGKIGFTTKETEGSYFWFTLPKE